MSTLFQSVKRKRRLYCIIGAVLGCVAVAMLVVSRVDPHYREVRQLVAGLGPYRPFDQEPDVSTLKVLNQLGPKAYPALAKILRSRDSKLDLWYDQRLGSLPSMVRRFLPERQSKHELRRRAKAVVNQLGPVAPRAMVGAIRDCLHRKDSDQIGNADLVYPGIADGGGHPS